MNIATIFSGLVTLAAAIPKIKKLIDDLVDMWTDRKIEESRERLNHKQIKQKALYAAIKNAKDDETRIALSIVLHDITRM
tara:strand:+ start:606 stop:845 length:240 start_codon:yes stop_codon:yes gene_type:complete